MEATYAKYGYTVFYYSVDKKSKSMDVIAANHTAAIAQVKAEDSNYGGLIMVQKIKD